MCLNSKLPGWRSQSARARDTLPQPARSTRSIVTVRGCFVRFCGFAARDVYVRLDGARGTFLYIAAEPSKTFESTEVDGLDALAGVRRQVVKRNGDGTEQSAAIRGGSAYPRARTSTRGA